LCVCVCVCVCVCERERERMFRDTEIGRLKSLTPAHVSPESPYSTPYNERAGSAERRPDISSASSLKRFGEIGKVSVVRYAP